MPESKDLNTDDRVLKEVNDKKEYITELQKRRLPLAHEHKFKPGDIVVWKEGMKNKSIPDDYITPGIVINLFYPILVDEERDFSSSYFNEILDVQVGFITKENEFIVFAHDSRRFELYDTA